MTTPSLDHIVLLLPHTTLTSLPPWLTTAFTILPGGRHTNGATENKLILFADGVYIELIAFVPTTPPAQRAATRWGRRCEGEIVDWALTLLPSDSESTSPEEAFGEVRRRVGAAGAGVGYATPIAGGRTTPDGVEVRWAVAVAEGAREGEVPFWCLDRTPRAWRVPFLREGVARHASGVVGVAGVEVGVGDVGRLETLGEVYAAVFGEDGERSARGLSWELPAPVEEPKVKRRFALWLREDEAGNEGALQVDDQVHITLSLFTTGESRKISGLVAPGRSLEINLMSLV
ncbi:glyoxalase-like domain-containing protein [Lasiosphaeris hirsuta]|uniref:Glyoxalase-like domain-containing protein n=1 Tax=Lasiosphaeris hirsuta TaxID=260670 RepID=A0AA40DSP7_9PEZI|nr:glyoxalase-like domain-containing protein [Lasiosphaeris hirsuta]